MKTYETIFCKYGTNIVVGRDSINNFTVAIKPDRYKATVPYLKVYNHYDRRKSTQVLRLSLKNSSRLITHYKNEPSWRSITREECDHICEFLDSQAAGYDNPKITNWILSLYYWNDAFRLLSDTYPDKYNSKLDAYIHGYYNTKANKQIYGFVPSNQKRPRY